MNELLSGKFAPITDTIGFLRCGIDDAVSAFLDWQGDVQSKRGVSLDKTRLSGGFASDILRLLPLTSVERRRFLFVPTQSHWTAFLDNGHKGTDAFSHISYLAEKLSCIAVRSTYIPEECEGRYPATILEIFGANRTEFLNSVRSISVAFDGARWAFSAEGQVQPFENAEKYSDRVIKNRFTGEMLKVYLGYLGITAFDDKFYDSLSEKAVLVSKNGPIAPAAREFTLAT